jgi:hypothetical protein
MDFSKDDAKWAKKLNQCRNIVRDISEMGIDSFQKIKLIELLALELDNREHMMDLVKPARRILESIDNKETTENSKRRIEI